MGNSITMKVQFNPEDFHGDDSSEDEESGKCFWYQF